ncbi:hypothetical protein E1298_46650 [Actinomadura rubrisoli]|uniref:Uncharacterized protein n=1 Tax=Actinomadura rubrisoli TaxID=2530368 RepID=A0A4R4ZLJ2_9ACTN|nr:hypothetical protein E1298_46650 [Actinomadura rubrisoli]
MPGPGSTPPPHPVPAPVAAQPKDFVGQLPPAAPPPVPPPAPGPYETPSYGRRGYAPYSGQPSYDQAAGYPPPYGLPPATQPDPSALQRRPEQGGPYDPRDPRAQEAQRRAERPRDDRDKNAGKPYGWYRVLSFLVLVALLGFANIAPLPAMAVAIAGVLVLRMADKAAKGMEDKRTRRGPRSGDAVAAAFKTPLHLPGAVLVTVLLSGLSLCAGGILLGVLIFAQPDMAASRAIAISAMAVIGLLCLAPGSGAPRRQMARMWGAVLPRTGAALAGVLILGIFAAVLVGLSQKQPPDTTPLDGMSQDLESLRADVHDRLAEIPGI